MVVGCNGRRVRWWSVDRDGGRGEMTKQEDEKGNEVCYTNGKVGVDKLMSDISSSTTPAGEV